MHGTAVTSAGNATASMAPHVLECVLLAGISQHACYLNIANALVYPGLLSSFLKTCPDHSCACCWPNRMRFVLLSAWYSGMASMVQ